MRSSLKFRFGKAFTLIELLIVITIIGILAVALVPRISQGPARARDVARKADLSNISNALELYFADNNAYPDSTDYTNDLPAYLKGGSLPTDPSGGAYPYTQVTSTSYIVAAQLETDTATGDNVIGSCQNAPTTVPPSCSGGTDTYYYLTQ